MVPSFLVREGNGSWMPSFLVREGAHAPAVISLPGVECGSGGDHSDHMTGNVTMWLSSSTPPFFWCNCCIGSE